MKIFYAVVLEANDHRSLFWARRQVSGEITERFIVVIICAKGSRPQFITNGAHFGTINLKILLWFDI